ncbi:hypothetical protein D9619_007850 [Psilocybe cf. subviscida]|uniref:Large ribosomal subunit protein mL59 domain-containing protein n=1 Tax=Psilocybe cf. subviscida TaxID=2480587 RepID=A0A8H5ATW9_9AGAR|nr:hypothetical protein D9619_007850 [Psilocybe cf. subviscida]
MATPTHRGAMLAAKSIRNQQVRGVASSTRAVVEASAPLVNPAQQKILKRIKKVRADEITQLVGRLSLFGPMPVPTPSADGTTPMQLSNPFLARKNIKTGKWRPPAYSLRRQADLAKLALKAGHLDKLPPGPKTTALKDRIERVKMSLSQSDVKRLDTNVVPIAAPPPKFQAPPAFLKARHRAEKLANDVAHLRRGFSNDLERAQKATEDDQAKYKEMAARKAKEIVRKEAKLVPLAEQVNALAKTVDAYNESIVAAHAESERRFTMPVEWVGKLPEKKKGAELGVRLYANKKRMFKGHLWERARASRVKKQAILMRHMAARVARYKDYYKKRRPNPLKPPRYTKPPRLPF